MNELIEAARDVVLQEGRYPPTRGTRELAEVFKSLVVVPKAALRRLDAALAALPPSAPPALDVERLARAMSANDGVNWPKRWGPEDFAWVARQVAADLARLQEEER